MFTDSHTHLYLKDFDSDLETVIQSALDQKINRFLLPNIDNKSLPKLLSVCKNYKGLVYPMIGLHPCQVDKDYTKQLEELYNYINSHNFIAIGEIGIDLYWETKFLQQQKEVFRIQIKWAQKHNLPIVIHCRNAFDEIYEILEQEQGLISGVFHCFSGTEEQADKIIQLGFLLGIGGVLTFKNSNLDLVLKNIDLKHILLETDAPYLTPHPLRGKRNEPKYLTYVIEKLCQIKGVTQEELALITNKNIDRVFFTKT